MKREQPEIDPYSLVMELPVNEIRNCFMAKLDKNGFKCERGIFYPESQQNCDILAVSDDERKIYIKLKTSARWTDGLLKKDFEAYHDWEKLERDHNINDDVLAFFALNVTPKYKDFPADWMELRSARELPCRNLGLMAITRFWKNELKSRHHANCRLYLKEYHHPNPEALKKIPELNQYSETDRRFNSLVFYFVNDVRFR